MLSDIVSPPPHTRKLILIRPFVGMWWEQGLCSPLDPQAARSTKGIRIAIWQQPISFENFKKNIISIFLSKGKYSCQCFFEHSG